MPTKPPTHPEIDAIRAGLIARNNGGERWADIAASLAKNGVTISAAAVWRFAKRGEEPANALQRELLGLPPRGTTREIIPIVGEVWEGTQVPGSRRCACGKYFVPNVPNRNRCYFCYPGVVGQRRRD